MDRRASPGERRRQLELGLGLLLLFAGLFLVLGAIPDTSVGLAVYVELIGGGLVCAWVSGMLMGRASRWGRGPGS